MELIAFVAAVGIMVLLMVTTRLVGKGDRAWLNTPIRLGRGVTRWTPAGVLYVGASFLVLALLLLFLVVVSFVHCGAARC